MILHINILTLGRELSRTVWFWFRLEVLTYVFMLFVQLFHSPDTVRWDFTLTCG